MFRRSEYLFKSNGLRLTVFIFVLLVSALSQAVPGQTEKKNNPAEIVELQSGKSIEREISPKEIHLYQISLAENQFASVLVEQRGIDVVARIADQTGKKYIMQRDSVIKAEGREKLDFVGLTAGVYRIEIEGKIMSAPKGNYFVQLAEVRSATEREKHLEEARAIHNDGVRLWNEGKFSEALPVAEKALEIREKESGEDDIDVAASLASLALIVNDLGEYERAIGLYQRALKIREKAFGTYHQDVARIYHNMAIVYTDTDAHEEAIRLYGKAIEIREKVLGPDNLELASSIGNLGLEYKVLGNYEKAEELMRRALEIKQRAASPNYSSIAFSMVNLGTIYAEKGDRDKALELYNQAIGVWEKALGAEHPNISYALLQAATIYADRNDFEQAEKSYLRSLNILRKVLGSDHQRIASVLGSLAIVYHRRGDDAKAEPLFLQTVAMMEKTVGKEHSNYAAAIINLAVFYTDRGDYERAEPLYQEAIKITEKIVGTEHPLLAQYLEYLARNYEAKGSIDQAMATLERAHRLSEKNTGLILFAGSERQKLIYLNSLTDETNQFISAQQQFAPDNPTALEIALTTVLERKGRVSDATASEFAALRNRFDKNDQTLLDDLQKVVSQLSQKTLKAPAEKANDNYQAQIRQLEERKEKLETEISRRSAEFRSRIRPVTIAAVQSAIPDDAALVEFSVYRPFNAKGKAGSGVYGEPRYVAYIIRNSGAVQWKDLGSAPAIDEAVKSMRLSLSDPQKKDVQQTARLLDEKIMQPVRTAIGDAKHLLISPDGELNLIPFEALLDARNHFLIENYSFTYLTGGRDLLRMQLARSSKNGPLLIANPQFGAVASDNQTAALINKPAKTSNNGRQSVTATRNLRDTYFAPLGGTAAEARSIQTLFPDANVLTGAQATENALKQAIAPRILHIATHGFFLEDEVNSSGEKSETNPRDAKSNAIPENPLLRSGLALAGANQRGTIDEDGILTALEASGLNLWGTKLVVLSACDTGLGEVKNGEGVYGLRRAFTLAGTESMVMSLWAVSDAATRELMTNYYKNLKAGMGRGESLRQVQLAMLKKKGREHPFYWAAFIESGEWANLDGKR